ncbi:hypothetical protein OV450_1375 [Actinobacteria bacterium OV450]|nr:hypothetical protein OV450_1375 [Actinobacteria bacterium OV450]
MATRPRPHPNGKPLMSTWTPRLVTDHLPSIGDHWTCRACATAWPCPPLAPHLVRIPCTCGSDTWREARGPRSWHIGPRCHTEAEAVAAKAESDAAGRPPHYPPSHYYPAKPHRPVRQRPALPRHQPAAAGDVQPGMCVWVKPGGLHPGWGDIHQLALVTRIGRPKCEVWLLLDGTVHQVRADAMILDDGPRRAARAAGHTIVRLEGGVWDLLPDWKWLGWTLAQHLDHTTPAPEAARAEPVQDGLFAAMPADPMGAHCHASKPPTSRSKPVPRRALPLHPGRQQVVTDAHQTDHRV